eukprot:5403936-Amphidinium_carterae.1
MTLKREKPNLPELQGESRHLKAMVSGPVVTLGHNLLEGPIPQHLLGGSGQAEKLVVAEALECPTRHQGQHATCLTRNVYTSCQGLGDHSDILSPGLIKDGVALVVRHAVFA